MRFLYCEEFYFLIFLKAMAVLGGDFFFSTSLVLAIEIRNRNKRFEGFVGFVLLNVGSSS